MLRRTLLMLSRSDRVKHLVSSMPVSSGIVARFVAGESVDDAVDGDRCAGRQWPARDARPSRRGHARPRQAQATVDAYVLLLERLADKGLTHGAEVSVKLSAVGQALPATASKIALDNARVICAAAAKASTAVTLDMEDHTTTDSTLEHPPRAAQRLPRHRCRRCRPTCTAPRGTAATSRTRARGCGCARAPTRSRSRSPSRTSTRSTCRTSAASRC